jgi:nifR3 family TIM-barrel protein
MSIVSVPLYLAPMDDVTDTVFRQLCKEEGADFVYTEFVAAESLIRDVKKSFDKIIFSDEQRPIGIQIFGNNIFSMQQAALIAQRYKPDEININCGCPVKKIVSKGCGAALLKYPEELLKIVKAVIDVVDIPVSVKTRLGWDDNSIIIDELVERLQDIGVQKVIIHARTKEQMYSGNIKIEYLRNIKENKNIKIPIIGNGNVVDFDTALKMQETNVDGIMIGRAAIGNPWIFSDIKNKKVQKRNLEEIVEMVKKHLLMLKEYYNEKYAVINLKKHYANYFKGFNNAKNIRVRLMNSENINDIISNINDVN